MSSIYSVGKAVEILPVPSLPSSYLGLSKVLGHRRALAMTPEEQERIMDQEDRRLKEELFARLDYIFDSIRPSTSL